MKKPLSSSVLNPANIYVSFEVECTGPLPGKHSILSFHALARNASGSIEDSFATNVKELEDGEWDPSTIAYAGHPDRRKSLISVTSNPIDVEEFVQSLHDWLIYLKQKAHDNGEGKLIGITYPSGFHYFFLRHYLLSYKKGCVQNTWLRDPFNCRVVESKHKKKVGDKQTETMSSRVAARLDTALKAFSSGNLTII